MIGRFKRKGTVGKSNRGSRNGVVGGNIIISSRYPQTGRLQVPSWLLFSIRTLMDEPSRREECTTPVATSHSGLLRHLFLFGPPLFFSFLFFPFLFYCASSFLCVYMCSCVCLCVCVWSCVLRQLRLFPHAHLSTIKRRLQWEITPCHSHCFSLSGYHYNKQHGNEIINRVRYYAG